MCHTVIESLDLPILLIKLNKLLQWFLQRQAFLSNQTHGMKIQTLPNFFISTDMIVDAVRDNQLCLDEWIQLFTSTYIAEK